jgi:signal transduction histidine kinase
MRHLGDVQQQQAATAKVLSIIGRSTFDLQAVLQILVDTAAQLCKADAVGIVRQDRAGHNHVAHTGLPSEYYEHLTIVPLSPGRNTIVGRVLLEGSTVQISDASTNPGLADSLEDRSFGTWLGVPLERGLSQTGVMILARTIAFPHTASQGKTPGLGRARSYPFSSREITLAKSFAAQAVIAIENTRLFEEITQKSRELEIASQHKSQFVANMSHELRTPLAAMLGYAELLQEGIYGGLPEKSLPILMRIQSNGNHLLGLINTVLDISKIEAGQFKLNLAEYALGSIVETVTVATESLAETKKLILKTEVVKPLPIGLGDEQRLTQVLLNLVGNAIKFTDVGEVCIAAGAANGHFTVSVSDTGPGIPPEEREHIFEKFRQVDSSNTRAKGGTGLGLAIAREIVEMHGGRIWVESTLGQGSTFRMELPVRAAVVGGAA